MAERLVPGGTCVSLREGFSCLCLPSTNMAPALLADSATLGFAISAVTLESTAAGDFL